MLGVVIWTGFVLVSIFNYLTADRVVEKTLAVSDASGKPLSRLQQWVVGSPPSGDHVRKRSVITGVGSLLFLVVSLVNA